MSEVSSPTPTGELYPVEAEPNVQVFTLRQVVSCGQDDDGYDLWHRRQVVVEAFDKGYGLLEHPKKTTRQVPFLEATFEVEYRAMGVKLHA